LEQWHGLAIAVGVDTKDASNKRMFVRAELQSSSQGHTKKEQTPDAHGIGMERAWSQVPST
jgi:hypothetical protein